jgi:hypothetical protein
MEVISFYMYLYMFTVSFLMFELAREFGLVYFLQNENTNKLSLVFRLI